MSSDKTEEPSESKLKKARDQGNVPKSTDLTQSFSLAGVVMALVMLGDVTAEHMQNIIKMALAYGDKNASAKDLIGVMSGMALEGLEAVFPFVFVAALFAIIGTLTQVGVMVAMAAAMPKLGNISPAKGITKIFSVKSLWTLFFMLLKALILGTSLWYFVVALIPLLTGSVHHSALSIGTIAWTSIIKILWLAVGLFIAMGVLDYAIQKMQFMKQQRMSKDEVKREHKEQDGDPHMKGQRQQMAHEIANDDPRPAVEKSNVVIVNPTHYAVAIFYVRDDVGLPRVTAKGFDNEALIIRQHAEACGIPVVGNPQLARALFKVSLNQSVPEELLASVAAVLRWVDDVGARRST